MAVVCNSAQIEQWCKFSSSRINRTNKDLDLKPASVVHGVHAPAGPSLNVTDLPDVLLTDVDHHAKGGSVRRHPQKGSRRSIRMRQGPSGTSKAIGLMSVQEEEEEQQDDFAGDAEMMSHRAESERPNWICGQCTFENSGFLPLCEMCEAPSSLGRVKTAAVGRLQQQLPEDRDSAKAWPSLAQAGHHGVEPQWETVSSTSWLDVMERSAPEDDASSVLSFINVGDSMVKHEDSDEDGAESVSSFLVVSQADEVQEAAAAANAMAASSASTWAARAAAATTNMAGYSAKPPAPGVRQSALPAKAPKAAKQQQPDFDEDDDCDTWGRRGQVHRGRQWQKHGGRR